MHSSGYDDNVQCYDICRWHPISGVHTYCTYRMYSFTLTIYHYGDLVHIYRGQVF